MNHGCGENRPFSRGYGRVAVWGLLAGAMVCFGLLLELWAAEAPAPTAQQSQRPVLPETLQQFIPTRNLWDIMRQGGPLMIPIALCSVIMLALTLERMVSLRRSRVIPKPFVKRFLQQMEDGTLDRDSAIHLCEENGTPVAEVFAAAVRKWGRPSVEVEQAIIDAGERVTNGLRKYLRVFNGITTVAPLLGLLGTISGMIQAFNALALSDPAGRTRPQLLAEGIANALLTTAAGLCVAIPALILYLYFLGRVDRLVMEIDSLGEQLVPMICAEEMGNRPAKPQTKSRRSRQETGVT
ncbi:MAG: MotA/TolQ/ExbB proton channel family protein [Thermoguttaceae bacterium]|nr:MotA/TolQ/ExbB proton channel family protein [Thermoguttaceae bacterium]